ncbi:MAG: hypothetical protein V7699_07640 [Porticoccus sp.]
MASPGFADEQASPAMGEVMLQQNPLLAACLEALIQRGAVIDHNVVELASGVGMEEITILHDLRVALMIHQLDLEPYGYSLTLCVNYGNKIMEVNS